MRKPQPISATRIFAPFAICRARLAEAGAPDVEQRHARGGQFQEVSAVHLIFL
jgi:hypothetical protein